MLRLHLFISGNVQGVNFRYWLQQQALESGISGWVKNVNDRKVSDSVEAVLEGEDEAVQQMLAWCKRGPPAARVDKVEMVEEEYEGKEKGFEVRF